MSRRGQAFLMFAFCCTLAVLPAFCPSFSVAQEITPLRLPTVIDSSMVLQRDMPAPIWGWAQPGTPIVVECNGKTKAAKTGVDGRWTIKLDPMAATCEPLTIKISDGTDTITLDNILVGEVWVCSGQSNMQWTVQNSNDSEAEIAAANYPNIRLFQVPLVGTQEPQYDCEGEWKACSPETIPGFTAVGYYFGRKLHKELDVPVGLIQTAWGGSACEAWIRRDLLKEDEQYAPLMEHWKNIEATFDWEAALAAYRERLAKWELAAAKAKEEGKPAPAKPRVPRNQLTGQHRPANCYNGMILPILPYGIRGAIWYQGESNSGRAYQYRTIFPLMITSWRDQWGQGDFPFYFVQLANFRPRVEEPGDATWAELREAQTMTLALPNTGQAVIIDIGEANNIHPKNKQDVGKRLALNALAKDYGQDDLVYSSPMFKSMEIDGDKAVITFDHVGEGLFAKNLNPELGTVGPTKVLGFAIAGEDRRFVWADAVIAGKDKIVVSSDAVKAPVAVRYAWADNPEVNLYNSEGLPACPFRTDDWPGITADVKTP